MKKTILKEDDNNIKEKMHPEVEKMLKDQSHPLGKLANHPDSEGSENFEQLIANKRFKDVITNLKKFTGYSGTIDSPMKVYNVMVEAYQDAVEIEKDHKVDLENLAIKLVMDYFKIPEGEINFNASLVKHGNIDLTNIPEEPEEMEVIEEYEPEVAKRKFLHSLIQGSAVKTTYAFHLVQDELNKIDPGLIKMYSILSVFSEYGYWITPDKVASQSRQQSAVGKMEIDTTKEVPVVIAQATSFPFLIHELTKGVMEILSLHGMPQDVEKRKYTINKADFLNAEHWNLRLGPGVWETFVEMVGNADEQDIMSHLYAVIAAMPAAKFNGFMKELMGKTERAAIYLKKVATKIRQEIKDENTKNLGL